jgi:hypothetical protein
MPKTIVRAADYQERSDLTTCPRPRCTGTMDIERGRLFVTLTCPVCGEVREYSVCQWAAYADPMDEVD